MAGDVVNYLNELSGRFPGLDEALISKGKGMPFSLVELINFSLSSFANQPIIPIKKVTESGIAFKLMSDVISK